MAQFVDELQDGIACMQIQFRALYHTILVFHNYAVRFSNHCSQVDFLSSDVVIHDGLVDFCILMVIVSVYGTWNCDIGNNSLHGSQCLSDEIPDNAR